MPNWQLVGFDKVTRKKTPGWRALAGSAMQAVREPGRNCNVPLVIVEPSDP